MSDQPNRISYIHSAKNDMKKTWKTIDETLNRRKTKTKFPSEFLVNNRSDSKI